ncbi:hypothetical protein NBRGN_094_00610 [Nocardia brasiliensis NBRC 14402]|nr:hypothetical protein CEQ30_29365 [Nocardia brasiliensis]GAJ85461.1 hypothetical protein NBRGN_094_00610 [Nocardia brasiliensis NBRC 14402]SUB10627.1 Uncharacterised protein [Nocardia brasiliensis]
MFSFSKFAALTAAVSSIFLLQMGTAQADGNGSGTCRTDRFCGWSEVGYTGADFHSKSPEGCWDTTPIRSAHNALNQRVTLWANSNCTGKSIVLDARTVYRGIGFLAHSISPA